MKLQRKSVFCEWNDCNFYKYFTFISAFVITSHHIKLQISNNWEKNRIIWYNSLEIMSDESLIAGSKLDKLDKIAQDDIMFAFQYSDTKSA